MARYKMVEGGVYDAENFRSIPEGEGRYWREFEAWQAQGNTPDPKDPEPTPSLKERRMQAYEEERRKQGLTTEEVLWSLVEAVDTGDTTKLSAIKAIKTTVDARVK